MSAATNFVTNNFGSQIPCESSPDAASTSPARPLADSLEKTPCTYSEVAASRPYLLVIASGEGTLWCLPPKEQVQSTTAKKRIPATAGIIFRNDNVVPDGESDLSELSEPSDLDDNPNTWIKVVPRHTCSLESLSKVRMNKNSITIGKYDKEWRTETETVLNQAEEQLTTAQKNQISHRYKKLQEKP